MAACRRTTGHGEDSARRAVSMSSPRMANMLVGESFSNRASCRSQNVVGQTARDEVRRLVDRHRDETRIDPSRVDQFPRGAPARRHDDVEESPHRLRPARTAGTRPGGEQTGPRVARGGGVAVPPPRLRTPILAPQVGSGRDADRRPQDQHVRGVEIRDRDGDHRVPVRRPVDRRRDLRHDEIRQRDPVQHRFGPTGRRNRRHPSATSSLSAMTRIMCCTPSSLRPMTMCSC